MPKMKTFDQLVAAGKAHKWNEAPGADEIASAARFNQNMRAVAEQVVALEEQTAADIAAARDAAAADAQERANEAVAGYHASAELGTGERFVTLAGAVAGASALL